RRRHTRSKRDWSSDVCSSDLYTTGWIFGRGVAVREVGHEPGQSPVVTADAREAVARARALVNDADLKAHIQRAAMVVAGRVEQRSEERRVGKRVEVGWWGVGW